MKYTAEMASGVMIYIPCSIKNGSGIQKLTGGFTDTQTAWRSHKPTSFLQNKENKLKR
jgi:hypothetical protein